MKAPSPLLGFNNNVRHKGRVFHIQTEDSGVRHPHVITHLFADGGRILKTTKTSYAEHIGQERMAETVRAMMQEQHKAMFIALRDGQFDHLFDESASGPASARAPVNGGRAPAPKPAAPPPADPPAKPAPPIEVAPPAPPAQAPVEPAPPTPVSVKPPVRDGASSSRPPVQPATPAASSRPPGAPTSAPPEAQGSPASRRRPSRPKLELDAGAIHQRVSPTAATLTDQPAEAGIDLDLDALERAAAEAQTPFFQQIQDLPPPPAAVLGNKRASTGGYSVRTPARPGQQEVPPARQSSPGGSAPGPAAPRAPSPAPPPGGRAAEASRYAPSRPASIFATTRPQEGASIFGEDLISEKSLDEVILGYLAEDLDGPAEKK